MNTQPKLNMDVRCGDCPIRHQAVCAYSKPDELVRLDAVKTYRSFSAGETMYWAGEEMTTIGSVVTGVATLGRSLPDGRRQMVGLLLPSDFIGRPGRKISPFDVVAASDVMLCTFQKREFDSMMAGSPSLERRLLEMTLDELDSAREWMLLLGRKTAREKIASLLAIVARRDAALLRNKPLNGMPFTLPLTREAMADYLGLTIETVSRQMSALKRDGIIEMEDARRITVPDYASLLDEAGDDSDGGILE